MPVAAGVSPQVLRGNLRIGGHSPALVGGGRSHGPQPLAVDADLVNAKAFELARPVVEDDPPGVEGKVVAADDAAAELGGDFRNRPAGQRKQAEPAPEAADAADELVVKMIGIVRVSLHQQQFLVLQQRVLADQRLALQAGDFAQQAPRPLGSGIQAIRGRREEPLPEVGGAACSRRLGYLSPYAVCSSSTAACNASRSRRPAQLGGRLAKTQPAGVRASDPRGQQVIPAAGDRRAVWPQVFEQARQRLLFPKRLLGAGEPPPAGVEPIGIHVFQQTMPRPGKIVLDHRPKRGRRVLVEADCVEPCPLQTLAGRCQQTILAALELHVNEDGVVPAAALRHGHALVARQVILQPDLPAVEPQQRVCGLDAGAVGRRTVTP